MLTNTQTKAVNMLFEYTDEEVARRLRIKPETLEAWQRDPEFVRAVREHLKENRRSAVRILSRLYLDACRELEAIIHSDDHKDKPKVIIEVLKASGLFKEYGTEEGDYVGSLLDRLADEVGESETDEED